MLRVVLASAGVSGSIVGVGVGVSVSVSVGGGVGVPEVELGVGDGDDVEGELFPLQPASEPARPMLPSSSSRLRVIFIMLLPEPRQ